MTIRVGNGYDVHAFAPDRPLILGGVTIPYEYGLAGHSDADTVLHAVVNALLGAAALGDIGTHFPSSDERWKDVPSSTFVEYTYNLLREQRWSIGNVDVMVVAQRPRIAPYVQAMRANLANLLHIEIEQVSVKGATTDGLGFVGRLEGIASYAVVLIER